MESSRTRLAEDRAGCFWGRAVLGKAEGDGDTLHLYLGAGSTGVRMRES